MTVLTEVSPLHERAVGCSISHVTSLVGYLLAVMVSWLVSHNLSSEAFNAWGWRIPFLLALVWWFINHMLREKWREAEGRMQELANSRQQETYRWPLWQVLTAHRKVFLLSIALSAILGALYSSVFVYMMSYLQQFAGLPMSDALLINGLSLIASCLLVPWFARAADHYGRRPILATSFIFILIMAWPGFYLVLHYSFPVICAAVVLLVIGLTLMIAAAAVTYCELFPLPVRYSGCAFSYNLGVALLGGTSPLIIQSLVGWHGNAYWFAFYLMILSVLGVLLVCFLPETAPLKDKIIK